MNTTEERQQARESIGLTSERCGTCGCRLTWIEVAFGRIFDPVCGHCLKKREQISPERTVAR